MQYTKRGVPWLISTPVNCIPVLNGGEYLLLCAATVIHFQYCSFKDEAQSALFEDPFRTAQ